MSIATAINDTINDAIIEMVIECRTEILTQLSKGFAETHHDSVVDRWINIPLAVLIPVMIFLFGYVYWAWFRPQ
jgi:hypothetical protein